MAEKNTISTRISLEGAEDIIKAFRALGKEGEEVATKLEAVFAAIGKGRDAASTIDRIKKSFETLKKSADQVGRGFKQINDGFTKFGNSVRNTRNRVLLFTGALTGAGYAFNRFVTGGLDAIGSLNDLSESLNISAEDLQAFNFAAAQIGVDSNDFTKGIVSLNDALEEIRESSKKTANGVKIGFESVSVAGNKLIGVYRGIESKSKDSGKETDKLSDKAAALQKIFSKMGVAVTKDLSELDTLKVIADYFQDVASEADKLGLAIDLFGPKIGPKLVRFLNQGGDALENYKNELREFGIFLTNEQVETGDRAGDLAASLQQVIAGYRNFFVVELAPALTEALDDIFAYLKANAGRITGTLRETAKTAGTIILDIIKVLTNGPDSEVSNKWILDIRDAIVEIGTQAAYIFTQIIIPGLELLRKAAEPVAKAVNGIFGTELTGTGILIGAVIIQLVGGFGLLAGAISAVIGLVGGLITIFGGLISLPALIVVGLVAAGAAIFLFWDEIVAAAKAAFEFLKTVYIAGWEALKAITTAALDGIRQVFSDTWEGLKAVAQTALDGVSTIFADTWEGIKQIAADSRQGLVTVASDTWDGIKSTIAGARDGLFTVARDTWSAIKDAASGLGETLLPVWEGIKNTAADAFNGIANAVTEAWSGASARVVENARAIRDAIETATNVAGDVEGASRIADALVQPFRDAAEKIRQIVSGFGSIASSGLNGVLSSIRSVADSIRREINSILSALRAAISEARRLRSQSTTTAQRRASGGYITGPGTGTSDSIAAWLSNGEFVIRAAAVRKYGAAFFAALNGMRLPDSFMPKFAMGGLVSAPAMPMPAMALAGGGGGSSLTLVLDGQNFDGLSGPSDTIARLERAVKMRRLRSTGRASPYATR